MLRIGLISDTHGLMRPDALACMHGSDYIVHAGDICDPAILERLASIAPVTAVRGNNDHGPWAERLQETALLRVGGILVYVIHDVAQLDIGANAQGIDVVVSGHSHKPQVERREGILYVNPGSSGPRRFKLPIACGELIVEGRSVSARIVELNETAKG